MEKERVFDDYNEEQKRFIDRYTDLAFVFIGILVCWQWYLSFVHMQWESELINYYEYYLLREQTATVNLIVNALIVISGFILIFIELRKKHVK